MHSHGAAFHPGGLLNVPMRPKLLGELVQQSAPDIRVRHLSSAKEHRQFHLVSAVQKLSSLTAFSLQVVVVDLWTNPDLFQLDNMLILARFPLFPALLVTELAVIHQAADGRHCVRCDFNEIQSTLPRHLQRIARGDHANLLAFFINQPHLSDANALVDTGLHWSGYGWPP